MSEQGTPASRFEGEMETGYWELSKAGYRAVRWLMLARELGSWQAAAHHLLDPSRPPGSYYGLMRLWEMGRLKSSVEAFVLRDEYRSLFSAAERELAAERLAQFEDTRGGQAPQLTPRKPEVFTPAEPEVRPGTPKSVGTPKMLGSPRPG